MTRIICCIFLLLLLLETACGSIVTSQSPLTQETAILQTEVVLSDPQNILSANIQAVWWSPNATMLYYGVLYEGNFAYDIQNQTITKISVEDVLHQTPQVGILDQLPPYYGSPHISPSGTRAIYILQSDAPPIPTADVSIEGGEQLSPSHALEMWLWENGKSYSLGTIKQCWLSDSFWPEDEQVMVLVEFGIPMPSCFDSTTSPQAWLLNLRDKTSIPLFSRSEYPPLQVYGFSPNRNRLLVGFFSDETGANLHLLDTNTFDLIPLHAPVNRVIEWLDEHRILVEYRGDLLSPPYPIGILNLQSMEFIELLPEFNDLFVRNVKVSSDNGWMAFTTGSDPFSQDNLWFMKLP